MIEFIFMLTRDDQTLTDARDVYASIAGSGVRHVGCKDVGLPREELQGLMSDIRANGHTTHLEVVSESEQATLASARVAAKIAPDYLIGGTLIEPVQEILAGTAIRFFPYVGRIVGHPCLLRGSIAEIAEDARRAEALGVDGINLLAYRYDGDVDALVEAVVEATSLPVIAAGSVDSPERIRRSRSAASGRSRSAPPRWTGFSHPASRSRRSFGSRSRRRWPEGGGARVSAPSQDGL